MQFVKFECLVIQSIAYSNKVATIILIILLSFYFRRVPPQMASEAAHEKRRNFGLFPEVNGRR